jgi:two-component system chemotaxis sensor kinase CheA
VEKKERFMTDNSLIADFADETREHLEKMESNLLRLESDPTDPELLNSIFRSVHTIKGASEYLGFERIAQLSHRLESLLDRFRGGRLEADKVAVDVLIDARDRMGDLIAQVEKSGQEAAPIDDLLDRADGIAEGSVTEDVPAETIAVYGDEADTELFDIFVEQLAAGIESLLETAHRIARNENLSGAAAAMSDQVEKLASTANYMGYEALAEVYDRMQAAIAAFQSGIETAGPEAIESFLVSGIVSHIDRIRGLFPDAEALRRIDTAITVEITAVDQEAGDLPGLVFDEVVEEALDGEAPAEEIELDLAPDEKIVVEQVPTAPDNSLIADFAEETREHLEEMESNLLRLESDWTDPELLNTIFRSMHTIKGASEYLGFERIAQLSHRLENLLDRFRDGSLRADKIAVDVMIDARDRIGDLIAQIEAWGQEAAPIDDLLDRVAAIADGTASVDETAVEEQYGSEADTELFDIFIEQLTAGIHQLVETARRLVDGAFNGAVVKELAGQVEKLAATANYMSYDGLSAVYADMQSEIDSFDSRSDDPGLEDIDRFVQSTMVFGVRRIQNLFPDAQDLAGIDTTIVIEAPESMEEVSVAPERETDFEPDRFPASEPKSEPEPELEAEPEYEPESELATDIKNEPAEPTGIDQLLDGLPVFEENDRDSLLSATLDATFSSMRNGDDDADASSVADIDDDPMALQFSTEEAGDDIPKPIDADPGDADPSLAIIDDFGEDRDEAAETIEDVAVEDAAASEVPSEDEETVDLWPEADETPAQVPDTPEEEDEVVLPVIDFSKPAETEKKDPEPDTAETFNARSATRKSIRVDADKVDDLMNQVGELVVNRASFSQLFNDMRELLLYLNHRFSMNKADLHMVSGLTTRLGDATTVLGRVTGELQEQVMKVRMLPIARLFNRYPRLVHDLLKDANKKVQLQFRGEETELDRMVIEQLADPLIHIIRNAVDHGIEACEDRKRKGKPESGVLVLEAYQEGGDVVIDVTDDGKGIDLSRIRQKAVEKQLADWDALEQMDRQDLIDMIMLPGFSTTDEITHTSGRGVGMDVVKRNIEKINGSMKIETRQDMGTRIRIKIPLTLAIIPALMTRCGDSHLTIPLNAVDETLRIDQGEIFTVDGSEVMHLHDEPLPLIRLTDLLNIPFSSSDQGGRLFVVVVKTATGRTGFVVNELLGRQEAVIKPMEDYLQEDSGFSGATILGDGSVSLILNVDELAVMAKAHEAERKLAAAVL